MKLHLLIPSLFWPDPTFTAIYGDLPLPSLENLLAKSAHSADLPEEAESWLCSAFNVAKQLDWPVAPIGLEFDSNEEVRAKDAYWIRADPVHLHIEHDQIVLADSRVFKISRDEADQLTGTLTRHFHENGQQIAFLPLRPDRWYLRVADMAPARTRLLNEAANKNIRNLLPSGPAEAAWRSLFNEIQMLLHEHPVNLAREAQGEVPINAIWFWGGGTMPESMRSPYTHIWSNDVLAASLAQLSGTPHDILPANANALFQPAAAGRQLAVLDALHGKAQYGDAYGWRESLKNLERNWFEPVSQMLRRNALAEVLVIAIGDGSKTITFTIYPSDLRKFWRRQKAFASYSERAE